MMENGKVYMDSATLYIYNHSITLGSTYTDIVSQLTNYISSTRLCEDQKGKNIVVSIRDTKIYNITCSIYLYFNNNVLNKIKLSLHTDTEDEVSDEVYKSKLLQSAKLFKELVLKQYFSLYNDSVNRDNSTFMIKNKKYCFYSAFPKNSNNLICNVYLKYII